MRMSVGMSASMGVTVGVSVGVTVGVRMTTISMVVVIKWILKHLGRRTKA